MPLSDFQSQRRLLGSIHRNMEPITDPQSPNLDGLLDRIGPARVVLLGESTHGTKEFYELRAQISLALIREKGFNVVALESDWPDTSLVNSYIRGGGKPWLGGFRRFPEWMWRNHSFVKFVEELLIHNSSEGRAPVSIFGLDLYSLSSSLQSVLAFLEKHFPDEAHRARTARNCFHPWELDPAKYGLAVWQEALAGCEKEILDLLETLSEKRLSQEAAKNSALFSAFQNAKIIQSAEKYYRKMYEGRVDSWNLRDRHMFETLLALLDFYGPESKAVVWEHNSHIGNAAATEMGFFGEQNVGEFCKRHFGDLAYSLGFLTDHGTVAAAHEWDAPVEIKKLLPARFGSYEELFHQAGEKNFFLPLKKMKPELSEARLERAVGVIYRPETERLSHYFNADLTRQFDEICWIDETHAVEPLPFVKEVDASDTYPFGL